MRGGASDRDVTIGAVAGTGTDFGLIIDGTVVGSGVYAGKDATGLQIGGLGGAVDISGGGKVGGSVNAISKDASATAIRIGAGATVPEIRVSGKVEAKRSEEHTSEPQSLMRLSYAVFCLKKKKRTPLPHSQK